MTSRAFSGAGTPYTGLSENWWMTSMCKYSQKFFYFVKKKKRKCISDCENICSICYSSTLGLPPPQHHHNCAIEWCLRVRDHRGHVKILLATICFWHYQTITSNSQCLSHFLLSFWKAFEKSALLKCLAKPCAKIISHSSLFKKWRFNHKKILEIGTGLFDKQTINNW